MRSAPAPTALVAAWRDAPEAAEATRAAAITALEARRRAADAALRACAPLAAGLLRVRFDVAVESREEHLVVSDPTGAEVLEGPPLDDAALACMIAALAGHDEIAAAPGRGFLTTYDGPVDYSAALQFE